MSEQMQKAWGVFDTWKGLACVSQADEDLPVESKD